VRGRKYDEERIVREYLSGASMTRLREKYGVSMSWTRNALLRRGIRPRTPSEAALMGRWRKLVRVGRQRLVSLPYSVLGRLGFGKDEELWYEARPEDGKVVLTVFREPGKGRLRMYRMGDTSTRLLRILGVEASEGDWRVERGRLVLYVR